MAFNEFVQEDFVMDIRYVYTVSDMGAMIPDAIRSIRSLRKYVDKKDIVVFFTPPRSKLSYAILSRLAVVKEVDNLSKPFVFFGGHGLGRYGEKCHLCDVDSSTVVFLDADTIVKKDLFPLLEGDFDFSARKHFPTKESATGWIDENIWVEIFRSTGKEPVPMPNAGFMIFKKFCHHRIKEEWLKYINDDNLPNACLHHNPKEQTALALALSGKKIRWLTAKEHAFSWLGEGKIDTYVLHKKTLLPKPFDGAERILTVYSASTLKFLSEVLFPW
jgi:hypothetical protein